MNFHIITIFPEIFNSYFSESILGRAQRENIIKIKIHDLRQWTDDKRRTIDDTPYGGGAGMVMKIEPLYKALTALKSQIQSRVLGTKITNPKTKIILLSAKGKRWNQQLAKKYSKLDELIFICGRYEGVDERITNFVDEEISIGDYVLTGGEIPAMAIVDSVTRLLPGALGNAASSEEESHSIPGVLEYPQYTKPEIFIAENKKYKVPKILLSGHHKKVKEWREKKKKIIK